MTTIKVTTAAEGIEFLGLLQMAGYVLDEHINPEDGPTADTFDVLMNTDNRERMAARCREANAYRAEHPGKAGAKPLADLEGTIVLINRVLSGLATNYHASTSSVLSTEYTNTCFFEELADEIFAYKDTGVISDRS